MISHDALKAIITMSVTGSILAIALLILKPLVRHRLPKSTQYYLWLVVLATLIVPISRLVVFPDSSAKAPVISEAVDWYVVTNQDIIERVRPYEAQDVNGFIGISEADMAAVDALAPAPWVPEVFDWFRLVYSLGVMVYLTFIFYSYTAFTGKMKRRNIDADLEEHAMLTELCSDKPTPLLYRNSLADTPMLVGMINPSIILPNREYTKEQLRVILLHELNHLWRKDVFVKWISVIVTALHWFNPFAWIVQREIDRICELSCDEAVIRNLDADGKQNYGETLIYVAVNAKKHHVVLSTTMCEEKKDLKDRLGAIMKSKRYTPLTIIVSAVLIVAVAGTAIALGASRAASLNEPPKIIVESENTDIFWVVGKDKWNDEAFDRLDNFQVLKERIFNRDMPYIKNSEEITITFDGSIPDTVSLTEHILNENGGYKYNVDGMAYDISFDADSGKGVFTIESNFSTLFSSYSGDYEMGNTIKGYRLICTWGNNQCEYGFVILGDAATNIEADIINFTYADALKYTAQLYPKGPDINYLGEDTISYTEDNIPIDVYRFEIDMNGVQVLISISEEDRRLFIYDNGAWSETTSSWGRAVVYQTNQSK